MNILNDGSIYISLYGSIVEYKRPTAESKVPMPSHLRADVIFTSSGDILKCRSDDLLPIIKNKLMAGLKPVFSCTTPEEVDDACRKIHDIAGWYRDEQEHLEPVVEYNED